MKKMKRLILVLLCLMLVMPSVAVGETAVENYLADLYEQMCNLLGAGFFAETQRFADETLTSVIFSMDDDGNESWLTKNVLWVEDLQGIREHSEEVFIRDSIMRLSVLEQMKEINKYGLQGKATFVGRSNGSGIVDFVKDGKRLQGYAFYFLTEDGRIENDTLCLVFDIASLSEKPMFYTDTEDYDEMMFYIKESTVIYKFLTLMREGDTYDEKVEEWLAFNSYDFDASQYQNAEQESEQGAEQHKVKIRESGDVNVRKSSSADSEKVGTAQAGVTYEWLDTAANGWYHIRLKDGKTGYVSPKMATLIP